MKFIEVDSLPKGRQGKAPRASIHKYEKELAVFMRMNVKVARVEWRDGEFYNCRSAHQSMLMAVKRHALPIDVHSRDNDLYVVRRDI